MSLVEQDRISANQKVRALISGPKSCQIGPARVRLETWWKHFLLVSSPEPKLILPVAPADG